MSLDLIIGPMFCGKTTELLRRLYTLSYVGKKCLYINHLLDTRENTTVSTHNPIINKLDDKIDSIKTKSLVLEWMYFLIQVSKTKTFREIQDAGKRPRFSIKGKIIRPENIKPVKTCQL